MAVEAKRGCGYRKVGGLYLVSPGVGEPCERLPIPIMPCTICGHAIPQTRGWQWANVAHLLAGAKSCEDKPPCRQCVVCHPQVFENEVYCEPVGKCGLLWIGEQYYPTPTAWMDEAKKLGVSRRIAAIPRGFVVGKSWVFVAHPQVLGKDQPGVFHVIKPARIELIVTPSMRAEPWVIDLANKGVTLVEVPENDPDHLPVKKAAKSRRRMAADRVAILPAPKVKDPDQAKLF